MKKCPHCGNTNPLTLLVITPTLVFCRACARSFGVVVAASG